MENIMTMKWIDECKNAIHTERAELNEIESMFDKVGTPSTNIKEAIERLNLMLQAYFARRRYGVFPAIDIMKEILRGQSYEVKELGNGKYAFIVGMFELELIPETRVLKVKSTRKNRKPDKRRMELMDVSRVMDEYDAIIRINRLTWGSTVTAAKRLAEISAKHEKSDASKGEMFLQAVKNYLSLKFTGRADVIYAAGQNYQKERERERINEVKAYNDILEKDILDMKSCGLYDILKFIEDESDCFVNFDIFIGQYSWTDGIEAVEGYLLDKSRKDERSMIKMGLF